MEVNHLTALIFTYSSVFIPVFQYIGAMLWCFQIHRAELNMTIQALESERERRGGRDGEETQAGDGERTRSRKKVGETDRNGEKLGVCHTCCHDTGESEWEQGINRPSLVKHECILCLLSSRGFSALSRWADSRALCLQMMCPVKDCLLSSLSSLKLRLPATETTRSTGWSAWKQNWPCLLSFFPNKYRT